LGHWVSRRKINIIIATFSGNNNPSWGKLLDKKIRQPPETGKLNKSLEIVKNDECAENNCFLGGIIGDGY
jgi:hypothetical protein